MCLHIIIRAFLRIVTAFARIKHSATWKLDSTTSLVMLTLPGGSLLKWKALLCGSVFSYFCFSFSSLFQFSFHSLSISSLISFSHFSLFALCILHHQPASFWNRWAGEARKWGWAAIAGNKTLGPIVWIPVAHWHSVRLQWHTPYELCLSWTRPEITSRIKVSITFVQKGTRILVCVLFMLLCLMNFFSLLKILWDNA